MSNPESLTIRRLNGSDVRQMRSMLDCFGEAFEDAETYCDAQPDDAYLERLLSDSTFVAIAALDGARAVGGLVAYELRKFEQARSEFYIYDLAVHADHRRRGVASDLIDALKPIARSSGGWVIFVQADVVDEPAVALYGKLGVSEDGVYHFDIPVDR